MRPRLRCFITCLYGFLFVLASFASAQSSRVRSTLSVTPQNGSGSSQVFTFVFSDSTGYQNVADGDHILFTNGGSSGTDWCWIRFDNGGVQLAPDNLQGTWPGVLYGSNTYVSNSQCTLNGAGTTISGSGNTLTLNLSVTFRVSYAGMKTIYTDINNSDSAQPVGTYNVTATAPDFTLSMSPSSQSMQAGGSVTYTVTANALNGFNQDITLSTYINSGLTESFNPAFIAGGSGTSTLTVTASGSAPSYNGSIQVVGTTPSITHSATSQLTVTAAAPPPPPTRSTTVTPQNGTGSSQVFTFVFSDSAGYQNVYGAHIIFTNGGSSGTDWCWMEFDQGKVYLAPDNLQGAWPGVAYGSSGSVQNSQCTINGAGTNVSGSGNTLTLNLSITFRPAFAGMKTIETDVNNGSGEMAVGTYTVTGTAPDFTVSMTPASQSLQAGQSAAYTVTTSPANGFNQDITLSATYLPSGVTASFNPSVIAGGSGSSTMTVTASGSAPSSNGPINISASSASVTHGASSQLTVTAAAAPPPPTLTSSVTPQNGSGSSQVFTFVFSSSAGYQGSPAGAHILFSGGGPSGNNNCWFMLTQNGAELAPDDTQGGWPAVTFGTNATVQNSQCTINGAGSSISGSVNTQTVNISITFHVAYAGMKTIYTDFNNTHGYTSVGTYTVTSTAADFTLSVSPSSQSVQVGQSVTYTVTAAPVNGFNSNITLSFGSSLQGVTGTFNPSVIVGGSGTSTLTVSASSTAPASNGSITVTGTSSSVTHNASSQLTVTATPPPPPPTLSTISASPQNGSGSSQVFTLQFSDSNGYEDLLGGKYHVLINSTINGSSSCWFQLLSTGVDLAPDDPSQAWTFVGYGSSTNAQNSQCAVSGVGTNVTGSGNNLTLSLALTFTPAYDGTRYVYTDVNSSNPDYVAVATYTVQ